LINVHPEKLMNWSNVRLIFLREVRDQLRDRRTLFMIAVLPLLLYPLLGTSFFQVAQFIREQSTSVLLIGAETLPESPPLLEPAEEQAAGRAEARRFAARLFQDAARAQLLAVELAHPGQIAATADGVSVDAFAHAAVRQGNYEAVIYFPADFADSLARFQQELTELDSAQASDIEHTALAVPNPKVYYNTAKEKSAITYARVSDVLHRWTDLIGRDNLAAGGVPESAARPFDVATDDVAETSGLKGAAVWSKILPFLLLIWALTGAFYPAVDLCAGEKERGTLETLLISPAERMEIVWGKLLTIMLFSMATALLNLLSMGVTGQLILSQLKDFGPPPALAPLWLLLALLPVSALFSALCLALAAFARSTKEGQYYLMPLVLVTMPLVMLPMSPGFELTLGNSLIPVTGVMLVLRSMLEGHYWQALPYVPVVIGVTLGCCLLAVRWAVDQFNAESVLFRESERLDLGLWLKHLLRDREDTPNVAAGFCCGVLILVVQFFVNVSLARYLVGANMLSVALVTQIALIAAPALLMTVMLTRSPRKTLLLNRPPLLAIPAAILLAVMLHPAVNALQTAVVWLYPLSDPIKQSLAGLVADAPSFGMLLLVIAVVPAICEELAFRGFILSGLRHLGHKRRAILVSAVFFGLAHSVFQQSLIACLMGVILAYIAVQTGSLLPGILFHMTHNALGLLTTKLTPHCLEQYPVLQLLVNDIGQEGYMYRGYVIAAGGAAAILILLWLRQLPYAKSQEESLQEAIDQHSMQAVAGT
jgi:sodium transport system permease protein